MKKQVSKLKYITLLPYQYIPIYIRNDKDNYDNIIKFAKTYTCLS